MTMASSEAVGNLRRRIGDREFTFTTARSSGPGGQNVNKVATRVTLLFDLAGTTSLGDSEKRRLRAKLATRLSRSGHLRVVSSRHRTQLANRRAATTRFFEILADALHMPKKRKPTTTPRRAHERRLRDKQRRTATKRLRSKPPLED